MKKKYKCIWELYNCTEKTFCGLSPCNRGAVNGTNKKAMENEIRFMLKQKYRTKEFRDNYFCQLRFFEVVNIDDNKILLSNIKLIKSI